MCRGHNGASVFRLSSSFLGLQRPAWLCTAIHHCDWNDVFREGGKATEGRRTAGTNGGIHSVHSVKGLKVRSCVLAVTALMLSMLVRAP